MSGAAVEVLGGRNVLMAAAEGDPVGVRGAADLIGDALGAGTRVVAIPATRLDPAFFDPKSGVAGEIAQKFVNYGLRLAILGDVSAHVARYEALAAWVRECNRGGHVWFLTDRAALAAHRRRCLGSVP
jgi:Domain of unknown function (DUF4180)